MSGRITPRRAGLDAAAAYHRASTADHSTWKYGANTRSATARAFAAKSYGFQPQ
jgi:hypothetical protein